MGFRLWVGLVLVFFGIAAIIFKWEINFIIVFVAMAMGVKIIITAATS